VVWPNFKCVCVCVCVCSTACCYSADLESCDSMETDHPVLCCTKRGREKHVYQGCVAMWGGGGMRGREQPLIQLSKVGGTVVEKRRRTLPQRPNNTLHPMRNAITTCKKSIKWMNVAGVRLLSRPILRIPSKQHQIVSISGFTKM